jgi:hypothetical protein
MSDQTYIYGSIHRLASLCKVDADFIAGFESTEGCYGAEEAGVILWERSKVEELGANNRGRCSDVDSCLDGHGGLVGGKCAAEKWF